MASMKNRFRQLHRVIAPIIILPTLLTLITGTIYQITDLSGKPVDWILDWHKGNFGIINLEKIYPFLIATGLLVLAITGISLWLQTRRNPKKRSGEI
jgi:hypothetical protein